MTLTAPESPTAAPPEEELRWGGVLVTALCRGALALVGSLVLWSVLPVVWGWTPQVILSDSMAPRIVAGDVVVTRPVPASSLRPGQIITVSDPDHPGRTRTHRFVRVDPDGELVTRGDANHQADSTHVRPSAVDGMAVLRIPYVGMPVLWLRLHDYAPLLICLGLAVGAGLGARLNGRPSDPGAGGDSPRRVRGRRIAAAAAAGTVAAASLGSPADAAFKRTATNTSNAFAAASVFRAYQGAVLTDSPYLLWRLQEKTGTTGADSTGHSHPGTFSNTPTLGQASPITGDPTDVAFGTGTNGYVTQTGSTTNTTTFSVEAWVKTTSTAGGRLIGFGDAAAGTASGSTDCQLYLAPNGKVEFGLNDNTQVAIASASAVNNGAWHHVVGTYSPATGAKLYVDGALSASGTGATPTTFTGYWRAGAEDLTGWPSAPTSRYLVGTIDEVAVYTTVLSAARVSAHYAAATS